jgi:hypothetical protein
MKKNIQNWTPGDVLKIPLADGKFAFARVLKYPLVAFYNLKTERIPNIDSIISSPVIFKIWVMKYGVTSGDWPVICNAPLTPELEVPPFFFKRDPISGALSIYMGNNIERPATLEECQGLECAAGWDPVHVVDRINDHFAGKPNKWVEAMRPRPKA